MEPRAAQLRKREGLRGEQNPFPREDEVSSGSAESPGGVGGGAALLRGGSCYLPSIFSTLLGGQGRRTLPLPLIVQLGEGGEKGYSELWPCLTFLTLSP